MHACMHVHMNEHLTYAYAAVDRSNPIDTTTAAAIARVDLVNFLTVPLGYNSL